MRRYEVVDEVTGIRKRDVARLNPRQCDGAIQRIEIANKS